MSRTQGLFADADWLTLSPSSSESSSEFKNEAGTSDLCQGQELLVVAFGDVDHQLLGAFWELP